MAAVGGTVETGRVGVGKIVLASLVGATIEFYDFYVFGTTAPLVVRRHVLPQVGAVILPPHGGRTAGEDN